MAIVEYGKGQDPTCMLTIQLESVGQQYLIALSPNAYSVCVAVDNKLYFYDTLHGKCDNTIENLFFGKYIKLLRLLKLKPTK